MIADLGTGTGALGLSLLQEMPLGSAEVWMTDESEDALHVARANAAGIGRAAAGARFAHGSWFDALLADDRGGFDVIVSNPPYIAIGDPEVDASVLNYEPSSALFAGADGLDDIRIIVSGAPHWLMPGGLLALEIGYTQGDAVNELLVGHGFTSVSVHQDLSGRHRFVTGLMPSL